MSTCIHSHQYELWRQTPDKNWVMYASIITDEDIVQYAYKYVVPDDRPTQLMQVLPSGRTRIALWINGVRVPIETIL